MTKVDGAVCDLGHAQNRSGDGAGCSKCCAQIKGGDDVFPLSAASSSAMERDDAATEGGLGAVSPPRWSSDVARNAPQPALLCLSVPLSF